MFKKEPCAGRNAVFPMGAAHAYYSFDDATFAGAFAA
jgi:hypothetical protein